MPVKLTAKSCTKLVTRRTKMTLVLLLFGLSTWLNVVDGRNVCFISTVSALGSTPVSLIQSFRRPCDVIMLGGVYQMVPDFLKLQIHECLNATKYASFGVAPSSQEAVITTSTDLETSPRKIFSCTHRPSEVINRPIQLPVPHSITYGSVEPDEGNYASEIGYANTDRVTVSSEDTENTKGSIDEETAGPTSAIIHFVGDDNSDGDSSGAEIESNAVTSAHSSGDGSGGNSDHNSGGAANESNAVISAVSSGDGSGGNSDDNSAGAASGSNAVASAVSSGDGSGGNSDHNSAGDASGSNAVTSAVSSGDGSDGNSDHNSGGAASGSNAVTSAVSSGDGISGNSDHNSAGDVSGRMQ
ncbi:uncharacterized protein [Apostichopus japonicus]|uniref:uncharacterized protein n=1 Tax=Stichopus japonicus TaxID=307972 RepID=UPI003AB64E76